MFLSKTRSKFIKTIQMKKMNHSLVLLVITSLLLFSCATPKVVYDYDKETSFSSYKTFNFYPDIQLDMNQLDSTRVLQQVENALVLKGLKKSSTPDVFVNIVSEQFETPSNNSIGIGLGSGGRNVGVGISGGIPIRSNTLTQLFKVDLIDVAKDALIWQGTFEGKFKKRINPEAKNEYFKITFEKIFSEYPPK